MAGRYARRLRPFWDGERITSLRTLAIGERVGKAGPIFSALRDALKAKAVETTHAEALELIANAFGYDN